MCARPAVAAAKFTLVLGGKITAEDALDDKSGKLVSIKAVIDLAKSAGNVSVTSDADAGVVSITHDSGAVPEAIAGWKAPGVTFVVDGKITKSSARVVSGVPYVGAKDLKKIAEALGYSADLDTGAGVLALTPKAAGGGSVAAGGGPEPAETKRPSYGLNGTFMQSIQQSSASAAQHGATAGHPAAGGGGNVCAYLDRMKAVWCDTEPSPEEKSTADRLAKLFQDNEKKVKAGQKVQGNPADLKALEDLLKSFNEKVQRRIQGTKAEQPPAGAEEWYQTSVEFLDDVDQTMKLSFQLVDIYKTDPKKQPKKEDIQKLHKRLQSLNQQVQAIGARENDIIVQVREAHGCGSANCGE
ncbi:MAG TPA: hypothetical protein VMV18_07820 [bacterium]|nr:hypothetical protein [bacterium]